jgi:tetratricopeptide (TPR) repeat protein
VVRLAIAISRGNVFSDALHSGRGELARLSRFLGRCGGGGMAVRPTNRYAPVDVRGMVLVFYRPVPDAPRPVTITFCLVLAGVLAAGSSIQLPVWRDSISLNRHALKCDSNNAQAHNNLARALAGSGRLEEAIPFFARYAELLPYAAKAHYQLGLAYQNHGDISGAIREYRICIRLDGGYVQGLNNLAWIRATAQDWTLRNPEEAIALASRALELSKTPTPAILDTLSAACARAGLYEDAIRHGSAAADLALRGGNLELGRQILERVKLYRAGQTYEE